MGQRYDTITPRLRELIDAQQVFFVATAPLAEDGHVNVSPKGVADTLAVIDETTVAYLDLTASGAETIAHLRENGRITLMFCSFDRAPTILRLYGRGRVVSVHDDEFAVWQQHFRATIAARAVIVVEVDRIADSCGFGLPQAEGMRERDMLVEHIERKGVDGVATFRRDRNAVSIDGLPAFAERSEGSVVGDDAAEGPD